MTELKEEKTERIDWEWEYRKLQSRITDCFEEIANIKQLYKKLNARITRMQYSQREAEDEDLDDDVDKGDVRSQLENMTLEERAILIAKLTDRE